MNDLKFAIRQLFKAPGFTAAAVLSLALGIGATTTVFCWIQSVLWRPLPGVTRAQDMVVLCSRHGTQVFDTVSYLDLKDYAQATNVFAGVIGSQITPACLTINGRNEWIYGQIATANFFDVLGVKPLLGRTFLAEEETKPGGNAVLVLGEGFWRRRFAADASVVGRVVQLNRRNFEIIGIVPGEFSGTMSGLRCDFWAPVTMHHEVANFGSLTSRGDRWLHTQARLAPGIALAQAQAEADTRAAQLAQVYPVNREMALRVLPLFKAPYGGQSLFLPVLSTLMAVCILVLLIVSANVANLLLVRAAGRQKEMAIRLALGASRTRLIRQLLTESVLLALLGGGLGVLFAFWAAGSFTRFVPNTHLPVGYSFAVNGATLAFTLLVAIGTGLLFGLAPAWQTTRGSLSQSLKEGGRTSETGQSGHRLRHSLVIAEVALALVLLVAAALCLQGFQRARNLDIGFDPKKLLLVGLRIGFNGYNESTGKVFYRHLQQQLAALPGVQSAALASWFPLGFEGGASGGVSVEGYVAAPGEDTGVPYAIVSPRYFETLRIPLLDGRDFSEQDDEKAPRAVVINEVMARRFWAGQNPLGRRLRIFGDRDLTVIGIVKSGKYRSLNEPPKPFLYLPYQQGVWDLNLGAVVRTEGAPTAAAGAVRGAVRASDPNVETWGTLAMSEYVKAAFLPQAVVASLLATLGVIALVLAAMGLYGVMAYLVSQRTNEIGIRMALGASRSDVTRLIMRQGLRLALWGVAAGLAGSAAVTQILRSFLHGTSPFDVGTFTGVALLLLAVSAVACFFPARRATRVDPVVALRGE